MRQLIILLLASLPIHRCIAQNEFNVWAFGSGLSLDFNSGSPVAGSSMCPSWEGSASICDANGALLFFTDGSYVYTRNNSIMPGGSGLMGNSSSTQSALICPDPANSTRYYIFTADQGGYNGTNQGVHYSIVDMTLNSGYGDVVVLNTLLMSPPATEKLTAVRHCNGQGFWIIVHAHGSDAFNAYHLSGSGVDPNPVTSNIGTPHLLSPGYTNTIGYLKASPDGKHLALANYGQGFAEFFDFDNATGVISNPSTITYSPGEMPYGISFSPDSRLCYVTTATWPPSTSVLYQYDISSGNQSVIAGSQYVVQVNNQPALDMFAAQLGPDGKIYVEENTGTSLDVINNPNVAGAGCNFTAGAVPLPNYTIFGLPNCIDALHAPLDPNAACPEDPVIPPSTVEIIPNVFTPGSNNINDFFTVQVGPTSSYYLKVYNRWGMLLWTSSDPAVGWNGETTNGPARDGTYYWILEYADLGGTGMQKTGFVELIREH